MKSHKINKKDGLIHVCIELNERNFINEPVENVQLEAVKRLLTSAGHNTESLTMKSGPTVLTNYTTKNAPPAILCGEWVFEEKKKKNEIKSTTTTSNKRRKSKTTTLEE